MFRPILKNFLFLSSAHIFYKILAFITLILIARALDVGAFGLLSSALAFVALFTFIADFGLSELLVREVAGKGKVETQKYIENAIGVKLFLSAVAYCLILFISVLFTMPTEIMLAIPIFGLSMIIDSFTLLLRTIFRVFERMEFESLSLGVESVLKLCFVAISIKYVGINILLLANILLAVSILVFLFTAFVVRTKFIKLNINFDMGFYKSIVKKTLPFALILSFGVINFKITILIVSRLSDNISTGLYSAGARLIETALVIPYAAAVSLFATGSRIHKISKGSLMQLHSISLKSLLGFGIFTLILINIFARKLVYIFLGEKYLGCLLSLRFLSISLIPFFIKFYLERFILILDNPKVIGFSYLSGVLITCILGVPLVAYFGYLAAAVALVLSEFFIVGYNLIWLNCNTKRISV